MTQPELARARERVEAALQHEDSERFGGLFVRLVVREADLRLILDALDGLGRGDEPEGWRPIESAPMNEPAEFWPPLRNCYGEMEQRFRGKFGCWSSLYKATHWRPLPKPPEPKP